jgi:hypothetical protein
LLEQKARSRFELKSFSLSKKGKPQTKILSGVFSVDFMSLKIYNSAQLLHWVNVENICLSPPYQTRNRNVLRH